MRDTPNQPRLWFAKKEIALVRKLCISMALDLVEPVQDKSHIVSHLQNSQIFHFAGHGYTDAHDPSESSLLLRDWENDR